MSKIHVSRTSRQVLLLMTYFSCAFLVGALCAGDIQSLLPGLWKIWTSPSQLTMDYFLLGGMGSAFLNTGLVGLACCALPFFVKSEATGVTLGGFFLTIGFATFGMTLPSLLPFFFGTWVYSRIRRVPFRNVTDQAMFATALAPFADELMFRYPSAETVVFSPVGLLAAIILGIFVGCVMPSLSEHARTFHQNYNLYNAGPAAGMLSLLVYCILFRSPGFSTPSNTALGDGNRLFVTVFFLIVFLLCIGVAFIMDRNAFKDYKRLWKESTGYRTDFTKDYTLPCTMLNMGFYGLFILLYYSLVHGFTVVDGALVFTAAKFNGVTMGAILCMYAFVADGANPKTVFPIMVGYFAASLLPFFLTLAGITESSSWTLTTQAMLVGVCFASGLAPLSGRYGFGAGVIGGAMHAFMVTTVPLMHGGFCLYNGGFTCGIVCFLIIPVLEHFFPNLRKDRRAPEQEHAHHHRLQASKK